MSNTNCLEGFKCPKCGHEDSFIIECAVLLRVTDAGTEDTDDSNSSWNDDSYCRCEACNHESNVAEFWKEAA